MNLPTPRSRWPWLLVAAGLAYAAWRAWPRKTQAPQQRDVATDDVLEGSFPASDPPSWGAPTAASGR